MTSSDQMLDGPHGPLRVRIYPAADPAGPLLVWAHGGGFAAGDIDMPEADWVAQAFAARGITVVSVDYALAPVTAGSRWTDVEPRAGVHHPVASEEVGFAFAWARDHASRWGADPARVALGGASAGANLATGAIVRLVQDGGVAPALAVLAYPTLHAVQPPVPTDLAEAIAAAGLQDQFPPETMRVMYENLLGGPVDGADIVAVPGSATAEQLRGFPPTVIVASEVDELRVSGEAFAATLESAGVDVAFTIEPGTQHGHLNRPEEPGATTTIDAFAARIAKL
jgi:acetyl esterase